MAHRTSSFDDGFVTLPGVTQVFHEQFEDEVLDVAGFSPEIDNNDARRKRAVFRGVGRGVSDHEAPERFLEERRFLEGPRFPFEIRSLPGMSPSSGSQLIPSGRSVPSPGIIGSTAAAKSSSFSSVESGARILTRNSPLTMLA